MKIVLLGHDDLPSLHALQRVISAAPQHDYVAFFSGELPTRLDTPRDLLELDARPCEAFLIVEFYDDVASDVRQLRGTQAMR